MTELDALLREPVEDPPPEIALAAVRRFRYRALLAISVAVSLILGGALLADRLLGPRWPSYQFLEAKADVLRNDGIVDPLMQISEFDDVRMLLLERVWADDGSVWFHFATWFEERRCDQVEIRPESVEVDGEVVLRADMAYLDGLKPSRLRAESVNDQTYLQLPFLPWGDEVILVAHVGAMCHVEDTFTFTELGTARVPLHRES